MFLLKGTNKEKWTGQAGDGQSYTERKPGSFVDVHAASASDQGLGAWMRSYHMAQPWQRDKTNGGACGGHAVNVIRRTILGSKTWMRRLAGSCVSPFPSHATGPGTWKRQDQGVVNRVG